jgi:hypothetical protein
MIVEMPTSLKRYPLRTLLMCLEAIAEQQGSRLVVHATDTTIHLDNIDRRSAPKGTGATLIASLCTIADTKKRPIKTYIFGNDPKLVAYYTKFGFKRDRRANDEAYYIRTPRKPKPSSKSQPLGPVVQRSERAAHNGVVVGSNPAGPTNS